MNEKKITRQSITSTFLLGSNLNDSDDEATPKVTGPATESDPTTSSGPEASSSPEVFATSHSESLIEQTDDAKLMTSEPVLASSYHGATSSQNGGETSTSQDAEKIKEEPIIRHPTATTAYFSPRQINPDVEFLFGLQITPAPSPEPIRAITGGKKPPSISPGGLFASLLDQNPFGESWNTDEWERVLKKKPYELENAPDRIKENVTLAFIALQNDSELFDRMKDFYTKKPSILFSIINQIPTLYTQVHVTYNEQARIELNANNLIINEIPRDIQANISFVEEILKESRLSTDENILKILGDANKSNVEEFLKKQTIKLQNLPICFRDDFDLVLSAVEVDGLALQYASADLKKNLAIVYNALHSNLEAQRYIDQEFQRTEVYLNEAIQEEVLYKTLPKTLQENVKQRALKELEKAIELIAPVDTRLEQIYTSFAPSIQMDGQFFYSFLEKIEASIQLNQKNEILHNALEKIIQSINLEDFTEQYKQKISKKVIFLYSFEGSRIHHGIWHNSAGTFRWASEELKPILKNVMYSVSFWQAIRPEDSLKQLHSTALEKDGLVLGFFPEEDKSDEDLVFKAVQQNGLALEFASNELRKNHSIVFTAIQNKRAIQFISSPSLKALADKIILLQDIVNQMTEARTPNLVEQIQQYVIAHPETEEDLVRLFEQYYTPKNKQMNLLSLEFAFKLHCLNQHDKVNPQKHLPLIATFQSQYQSSKKNNKIILQLIEALDKTNEWLNNDLSTAAYQQFAENLTKEKSLEMKSLGIAMLLFASLLMLSGVAVAATGIGLVAGAGISVLGVSVATLQIGFFSKKPPLSPLRKEINALTANIQNFEEKEKETTALSSAF